MDINAELEKLSAEELQQLESELDQQLMEKQAVELAQSYYELGVGLAEDMVKQGHVDKESFAAIGKGVQALGRAAAKLPGVKRLAKPGTRGSVSAVTGKTTGATKPGLLARLSKADPRTVGKATTAGGALLGGGYLAGRATS